MKDLVYYLKDIKIHHTVFSLPFVLSAFFYLNHVDWRWSQLLLIVLCVLLARNVAMGMNRILDQKYDRLNSRTSRRFLANHKASTGSYLFFVFASAGLFVWASAHLSSAAGWLALPLLVFLSGYSLMKRYVAGTHFYLGACLGMGPIAVAVALNQPLSAELIVLASAVLFWTAGFDLIYSCQDIEVDIKIGLNSIPQKYGVDKAILFSRACFALMILLFLGLGYISAASWIYYLSIALIAGLLAWEHYLILDIDSTGHSSNMNQAFFNINASVGLVFVVFLFIERTFL